MNSPFRGVFTPLVTPINDQESPDLLSLRRLVNYQIESHIQGIWALGTSAEFASFDQSERALITETIMDQAAGRVPVIVNISDASTRRAIAHGRHAAEFGAAAVAATPPYYYPHSQDELLSHYRALRAAIDLPLFIYNIPQTVRVRVELATAKTLVAEGVVAGIKDSQNDLEWFRQLAHFARHEQPEFALFAGTRHLIDAAVLVGAHGAIPSIANAFPDLCVEVYEAASRGDYQTAAASSATIVAIESLNAIIQPGSRNAATLGLIKLVLGQRGILSGARLTSPLRQLDDTDIQGALDALGTLGVHCSASTA